MNLYTNTGKLCVIKNELLDYAKNLNGKALIDTKTLRGWAETIDECTRNPREKEIPEWAFGLVVLLTLFSLFFAAPPVIYLFFKWLSYWPIP